MKPLRLLLLLIIALCLVLGMCGCKSNKNEATIEKMRDAALAHLNEKYDDEFKATSFSSGEWAYDYCSVFFSSKKYEDSSIEVRVYESSDGVFTFKDNYYHCFMMNDAIEYLRELTSEQDISVKYKGFTKNDIQLRLSKSCKSPNPYDKMKQIKKRGADPCI